MGQVLPAWAQDTAKVPVPVVQVIVVGSENDAQARREFVAGKMIIGRKRIVESGVRTVEEILRREPAITVSGNGKIGLLNMPGYTQVLVDGQQPTAAQAPDRLDLAHVEKIEIIKSSVAEYGPFGIAGTINVVTRKTVRKTSTQLSTGAGSTGGMASVNASLSHNQSTVGSPLRFSAQLSLDQSTTPTESRVRQTLTLTGQHEQDQWHANLRGKARYRTLMATTNATWQRGPDETISLSPEAFKASGPTSQLESRRWADGTSSHADQVSDSALEMFSLPFKWVFKPDKSSQFELFLRSHLARMETAIERADTGSAQQRMVRNSTQRSEGHTNSLELVYKVKLDGGHGLKAGASVRRSKQEIDYAYRLNDLADTALAALGTGRHALNNHLRLYAQDEWRLSESWAVNAGVSAQDTKFDVTESIYRDRASFRLWSPSVHVSKKIGADDKRQFRFSLARSFKAPDADAFTVRPEINPLAPCTASGVCGPNTIATADTSGNPALKAERSLGLNLSYEHGIGDDSQITVEVFARHIAGKIGADITLDNVSWSTSPRYVSRLTNLGDASSSGVNLEWELAVREVVKSAPKIRLRGSVGMARSRVSNLPGPDNRLDRQTPWTAKLGVNYALKNYPLKFDADANWSPSVWVRTSTAQRISVARAFTLDANANWTFNQDQHLVMSVKSTSPHSAQHFNDYIAAGQQIHQYTDTRRYTAFSVRFETKL